MRTIVTRAIDSSLGRLLFVSLLVLPLLGASPSPRTHFFEIEYKRPPMKDYPASLNVVFFEKVSDDLAVKVIGRELQTIVDLMNPKNDVLCMCWFSPDGDEANETQIGDTDAMPFYSSTTKKVTTFKDAIKK